MKEGKESQRRLQAHTPDDGRAACRGALTFFPWRGIPVCLIVFLLISQVTGVHCHRRLDFLLGHLHSVIEDLEEFLRLLIFCQPAEKGVLPRETHRLSTLWQTSDWIPLTTPKPQGDPSQPQNLTHGLSLDWSQTPLYALLFFGFSGLRFSPEPLEQTVTGCLCWSSHIGLGGTLRGVGRFQPARRSPLHTPKTTPLTMETKCIFGGYLRAGHLFNDFCEPHPRTACLCRAPYQVRMTRPQVRLKRVSKQCPRSYKDDWLYYRSSELASWALRQNLHGKGDFQVRNRRAGKDV